MVALLGLVGLPADAVNSLLDTLGDLGAPWAAEFVSEVLDRSSRSHNSGIVLGLGTLVALWVASAYVGSFMWASDRIYAIEYGDGRSGRASRCASASRCCSSCCSTTAAVR